MPITVVPIPVVTIPVVTIPVVPISVVLESYFYCHLASAIYQNSDKKHAQTHAEDPVQLNCAEFTFFWIPEASESHG